MSVEILPRKLRASSLLMILLAIALITASTLFVSLQPASAATTFTVDTTSDDVDDNPGDGVCDDGAGNCTLRGAIQEANATAGTDTIEFGIAPFDGSVKTITPAYDFDNIEDVTIIDGYTQDVASPNTSPSPNPLNTEILIEIDGTNANNGFVFLGGATGSAGSEIRGLAINSFANNAITIDSQNVNVYGNFIGTDAEGLVGLGNQIGITWTGAGDHDDGADANIGGLLPAQRNIISGNDNGPSASGSYPTNGWEFLGNYIGVDATGTQAIGNSTAGGSGAISIDICADVIVGGSSIDATNVISGNLSHGLAPDDVENLTIEGNYIGTDYTGTVAIGNGAGGSGGAGITLREVTGEVTNNIIANNPGDGIYLNDVQDLVIQGNNIGTGVLGTEDFPNGQHGIHMNLGSSGNLIGGTFPGQRNLIVNNDQAGVMITDNSDGTTSNTIIGNSIFNNGEIGIDLNPNYGTSANDIGDSDSGANDLLNFPVNLEYAEVGADTELEFSLDVLAGNYRVEFFSNTTADGSGYGEGQTYLGFVNVLSAGTGNEVFTHTITGEIGIPNITSTVTEIDDLSPTGFSSTSEYSLIASEAGVAPPSFDISATKVLLNPELVAVDTDIVYRFTIFNEGPDSVDLVELSGSTPGSDSLIFDILPPELVYESENNTDVTCVDFASGSDLGAPLANHPDYRLINCGYSGSGLILADGDSFTFDMTVHVSPSSDLVFTNHAYSSVLQGDPDLSVVGSAFMSGNDVVDALSGQNGNFPNAAFPIPVTNPPSTTVPGQSVVGGGALPVTGANTFISLGFAGVLALSGCLIAFSSRRSRRLIR